MHEHGTIGLLLVLGMCVVVPLGVIAAIVYVVTKRARDRHDERMAMIAQGLVPPPVGAPVPATIRAEVIAGRAAAPRDPVRRLGWAVGLVVAGVLWLVSDVLDLNGFGIILTALGAAYLTRGIAGMRREGAPPEHPAEPPGGLP